MNKELYDEAVRSNTLSKNLIAELMERHRLSGRNNGKLVR